MKHSLQLFLVAAVSCFVGSLAGPALFESSAEAQNAATAQNPAGRYAIDAYSHPGIKGCYIIDTVDGRTWHVEGAGKPQLIGSVGNN